MATYGTFSGWALLYAVGFGFLNAWLCTAAGYDPLAVDPTAGTSQQDLTFRDSARHRNIPLRFYLPADDSSAPIILFSHGLGGSRAGSRFLGEH